MSEWAAASWVHVCSFPGLRTLNGKGTSLSGESASSPGISSSTSLGLPRGPEQSEFPTPRRQRSHTQLSACCVEDANTAAPGHRLQRSPHSSPESDPSWEGHRLGPHLAWTPHSSLARTPHSSLAPLQQGPLHSLCHSVMEIMPQAAWGTFRG